MFSICKTNVPQQDYAHASLVKNALFIRSEISDFVNLDLECKLFVYNSVGLDCDIVCDRLPLLQLL